MSSVINSNVSALYSQNALKANARVMSQAMEQLSTGTRINSAKDDAAGLAISQTMTAQIRGLNQAVRNANDGINMLQTADGAMIEQSNMLQRMRELALMSANATYSDIQRGYANSEFAALIEQINAIASQTKWNSQAVLDGTGAGYDYQVGANEGETITVVVANMAAGLEGLNIEEVTISTIDDAAYAIQTIDEALGVINDSRAVVGAGINRLTYAVDNLANISQNTVASRSSIMDTDYAMATTQLAKSQIIQQAAIAMLAQANQQPQSVLALLK